MNIERLLNINLSELRNFSLRANLVDNEQNKRVVERNKTTLRHIEEANWRTDSRLTVSHQTIDELIKKVKKLIKAETDDSLTANELRILSYNLSKVSDVLPIYEYCLNTLENNWRDIYFNGLVFFVMSNWGYIDKDVLEMASTLLIKQLKGYTGANKRYLIFKDHYNLFEENGPARMCTIVKAKAMKLEEAPSVLHLNASSFNQTYYDDVIINYFSHGNLDNLAYIENVLEKHNSTKVKKLVFANLIIDANRYGGDIKQVEVGNSARRLLGGDISLPTTWSPFFGATDYEVNKLKRAYEIVTIWYAKQVIQTFFDVCVQSPERKVFWLQYVKEILDFRIVGSSSIKSSLQSDARVRQQLPKIFVETNSVKNRTAALVMYIRDRVFVEFSDTGSVYIYPPTHPAIRSIRTRRSIDSINDLKDTSIGKAVDQDYYYNYYNDYGLLRHIGAWQERLKGWMEYKILSSVYIPNRQIDNFFVVPTKPERKAGVIEENIPEQNPRPTPPQLSQRATKQSATSSNQESTQKSLFEHVGKGSKQEQNAVVKNNSLHSEKLLKSKHIFDGLYQICIGSDGLYILDVKKGSKKLLLYRRFDKKVGGQIWIKKQRTDGYLPIVYNVNDSQYPMGSIKMIGKEILYRDPYFAVKRFKVIDI